MFEYKYAALGLDVRDEDATGVPVERLAKAKLEEMQGEEDRKEPERANKRRRHPR